MTLENEIQHWRAEIKTKSFSMSIGELMNLYDNDELDLKPKFQRFFRWSTNQKSKFIESILLGIPLPSIFIATKDDGRWEVVDGLQRLSTLLEVAGTLKDKHGAPKPQLELLGTRYLPSMQGKSWQGPARRALTQTQRLEIKRARINVEIIERESDKFSKYELFQRLNTGGSLATAQEVRNCMLVDTNEAFFDWMTELTAIDAFIETTRLSDRAGIEAYDLELVTRLLSLRDLPPSELSRIGSLGEFLDEKILELAEKKKYPRQSERVLFEDTFSQLEAAVGGDAFRRFDSRQDRFTGRFLISAFESIGLGLAKRLKDGKKNLTKAGLTSRIKSVWSDSAFKESARSGISAEHRIPVTIEAGRRIMGD